MVLAAGAGVMLRADDAAMPSQEIPKNMLGTPEAIWSLEHYSYIAKDSDAMGIMALEQANELVKPQGPNAQLEFLQKMLYTAKGPAVVRAVHAMLAQVYHQSGQDPKAMEQYQMLISDNP